MNLLDSNIAIGAGRSGAIGLVDLIASGPAAVSSVTLVEVLGYHNLSPTLYRDFVNFFANVTIHAIDDRVIQRAIALRQFRKMSLGDALIAATALVHKLPLVTRNTRDFSWILGLTLIDPGATP